MFWFLKYPQRLMCPKVAPRVYRTGFWEVMGQQSMCPWLHGLLESGGECIWWHLVRGRERLRGVPWMSLLCPYPSFLLWTEYLSLFCGPCYYFLSHDGPETTDPSNHVSKPLKPGTKTKYSSFKLLLSQWWKSPNFVEYTKI